MAKKKTEIQKTNTEIRQPIVAVMGHVDHGKTSFLDSIRGTKVTDKEAGGITQNTRVHEVETKNGKITFIDTPGHEAFSKMRERGARVTDFVLLIVAADDGVQPQTKESIKFAHQNNVPIVVAINKIDIEGVKTQKIKQELSSFKVNIEEYGGDVMCFEISAKNKTGLDEVLEGISLLAEIQELKANEPKEGVIAEAFVLESRKDKHLGNLAVCILKSGSISDRYTGFTADSEFKVRSYLNEELKPIKTVRESQSFVVIGLNEDLSTGEIINFVKDEKTIPELQEKLKSGEVSEDVVEQEEISAEDMFAKMLVDRKEKEEGVEQKQLNVVVRTSSQGTLEVVLTKIHELETDDSKVNVVQSGTGNVTDDDIMMAKVSKAIVIAFQLKTPNKILGRARTEKVLVRDYDVIYALVDELADVLDGMDDPTAEDVEIARAKVKKIFVLSNGDIVAGCTVLSGTFKRGHQIYVERDGGKDEILEIGRSKVKELRINKSVVKEVTKNSDCGILFEKKIEDIEEGDEIVSYRKGL
ncbi:MAG: translation initiation factor IF-2 [Candidatus Dojkabacteria bacterium]|nr:translation initiation factor IF-2 [Candidatus Dojkabacteria bacterium]MDQ7020253.1 translation initiation factor IF-2 [Candidatus Dojkabacteria bacterium]